MASEEPSLGRHAAVPVCTPSRYKFRCDVCLSDIVPGDHIFPFVANCTLSAPNKENMKSRPLWAHRSCAKLFGPRGVPPPPTCRHWSRLGRCPMRDAGCCAFGHNEANRGGSDVDGGVLSSAEKGKRRCGGKRRVIRNGHKNSALRIFLIEKYGLEYLRSGVIMEVAGGKGELAWELLNLVGVECVNVDPRPMSLENADKRWRKGMYEPRRTGPVFQKWLPAVDEGSSRNSAPKRPLHLRCFFDAGSFASFVQHDVDDNDGFDAQNWLEDQIRITKSISWTTKGLQSDGEHESESHICSINASSQDGMRCAIDDCNECDGYEITNANDASDLITRTVLVLGLHPDQAAGDIADFADRLGVPFCIVPCCVYSELFTKRRLEDGTRVTTHKHLVQWLREKHDAKVETLGIEGKNEVVYTLP